MNRKIVFTLAFLGVSALAFAQTERTDDSTRFVLPDFPIQRQLMNEVILPFDITPPTVTAPKLSIDSVTFSMPAMVYTTNPIPVPRLGEGGNLFAGDYDLQDAFELSNNSSLSTYSSYTTYPTMGTIINAGAGYTHLLGDRWNITGGIYTTKYTMPSYAAGSPYGYGHHGSLFDAGVQGLLSYRVNDRIRLKAFGQYSLNGQSNAKKGLMNPMYPQSNYGMTMELRLTETFGIEGGMERIYNPMKMKWENVPVFGPVFYTKRKK